MKNKNYVEKYFTQKSWTVLEIILLVITIISAIVFSFVWGGGPIGLPVFMVALVCLIVSKSSKTKAVEVDNAKAKLLSDLNIEKSSKNCIEMYDPNAKYAKIGKDKALRSSEYILSVFDFKKENTEINVYRLDLLNKESKKETFILTPDAKAELTEEVLLIGGVRKTVQFLTCPSVGMKIPVTTNDIDASNIVNKICNR